MYVTTKGIIIREAPYKESDKILTVLTDSLGKITVRGKGVKRIKNKLFSVSNMFVYSEMTLFLKDGRYSLDNAEPVEQFYELRQDIFRLSLANYFAELCSRLTTEGVESDEILSLFLNALYILCKSEKNILLVKAAFELKLMEYAGYMPDLEGCSCGVHDGTVFDLEKGMLCCLKCTGLLSAKTAPVSPTVLSAMRYVTGNGSKKLFSFELPEKELQLFNKITEAFIRVQLDYEFKTLTYFYGLSNF